MHMENKIIDGKSIAAQIKLDLKQKIDQRIQRGDKVPKLAVVLVGEDPASQVYVRNKESSCNETGIESVSHKLAADTSQKQLIDLIDKLNTDPSIDGILVQLPLPKHLIVDSIISHITPEKDVDGFHPQNMGSLAINRPALYPCTPHGVMTLLNTTGVALRGKEAVVIGSSNIVGRPMALELINAGCTVTVCNSATPNLEQQVARADILVVAIGKAEKIPGSWIKEGSIVIDVGINRTDTGLVGDVEFATAKQRASWITPVPGGVGPMTIATLLQNTLQATVDRR